MEFREDHNPSSFHIGSYQPGEIMVNGKAYNQGIIVTTENLTEDCFVNDVKDISQQHIASLCAAKPEIILIGTGEKQQFLHRSLLKEAAKHNLSLDVMNTQAACRTFTVLATEGRRVIAALVP